MRLPAFLDSPVPVAFAAVIPQNAPPLDTVWSAAGVILGFLWVVGWYLSQAGRLPGQRETGFTDDDRRMVAELHAAAAAFASFTEEDRRKLGALHGAVTYRDGDEPERIVVVAKIVRELAESQATQAKTLERIVELLEKEERLAGLNVSELQALRRLIQERGA